LFPARLSHVRELSPRFSHMFESELFAQDNDTWPAGCGVVAAATARLGGGDHSGLQVPVLSLTVTGGDK
jgi:hypothetical protein